MKNKETIFLIAGIVVIFAGFSLLTTIPNVSSSTDGISNVTIVEGTQIIDIKAKGGFSPSNTVAKAGIPTTLRITTNGTFDCSASLVIPALNYEKLLPNTGVTEVEIPAQAKGKVINGMCSMGMYNFSVKFE